MTLKQIDTIDYLLSRLETNEYFDVQISWPRWNPEQWVEFFSIIAFRIIKTENIVDENWNPVIDFNTWKIRKKVSDQYYQHFIILKNLKDRIRTLLWEDINFRAFDVKEILKQDSNWDTYYDTTYNELVPLYEEKFYSIDNFRYLWDDIGWIASVVEKEAPYHAYHIKLDGTPLYETRFKTTRNFEWGWEKQFLYIPKEKLIHGLWVVWIWSPILKSPLAWWKVQFEDYFAQAVSLDGQYVTIDVQGEIIETI
jgi:hypothetical protein